MARLDRHVSANTWLFLRSLKTIVGRAPIWLSTAGFLLLLSLPLSLPWYSWFQGVTGSYEPGTLLHGLDANFRHDHRAGLNALTSSTARSGAGLFLLASFAGIFTAGGWLQIILERTRGRSLRRFFYGGSRFFFRFMRFWLITLLVLAGLHWVMFGWPWERFVLEGALQISADDAGSLETMSSERAVLVLGWVQHGLAALGFALVMCWGTFSRARLASHDGQSALVAGLTTMWTMLCHPILVFRPIVLLFLVEFALVTLLCGSLSGMLDARLAGLEQGGAWTVAALGLVGLFALVVREIVRGASYYAAVHVTRKVVPPLSRPDPYKAIGGPGGPQYPVEGDGDEYGVVV